MRLLLGSGGFRTPQRVASLAAQVKDFFGNVGRVVFVPYALRDHDRYLQLVTEKGLNAGYPLDGIHHHPDPCEAVRAAEAIFVGGGNTFRLLKGLYDHDLLDPIRGRVMAGALYIGSSAGSIVACPTLKTTKDMPVVQPPSFETLGLVPFQISPHYLDPDPSSTHMGETQEERILQFLEENPEPVVGLREGSFLRVQDGAATLKGPHTARVFRRGLAPFEANPGTDLRGILEERVAAAGRVA